MAARARGEPGPASCLLSVSPPCFVVPVIHTFPILPLSTSICSGALSHHVGVGSGQVMGSPGNTARPVKRLIYATHLPRQKSLFILAKFCFTRSSLTA